VGDKTLTGKVTGYKRDGSGNPIGKTNPNPLLNTRMYQVQFSDGTIQDYAANHIAEAIYAAVDDEGNRFVLLDEIIDYRYTAEALKPDQAWTTSSNGNRHRIKTTKGCQLCVYWPILKILIQLRYLALLRTEVYYKTLFLHGGHQDI
jgi:hypothetical protein